MDADLVVLDLESTPVIRYRMKHVADLQEALFVQMTLGDDRAVRATYVAGRRVYERPAEAALQQRVGEPRGVLHRLGAERPGRPGRGSEPARRRKLDPHCPLSARIAMATRPFRVLGLQQIAIGGLDKGRLRRLWVETLGLRVTGDYRSERENVDEDILALGAGPTKVEVDLMQPLDAAKKPAVHETPLNHVGLWIDDLKAAVEWLSAQGVRFAPGGIRKGAAGYDICFVHPKGKRGVPDRGRGRADRARAGAARRDRGARAGRLTGRHQARLSRARYAGARRGARVAGAALAFDESADGERSPEPRGTRRSRGSSRRPTIRRRTRRARATSTCAASTARTPAWVGYYEQPGEFRQGRVGYEYTVRRARGADGVRGAVRVTGILRRRRGRAVGGEVYGLIGVSRTNEKPYFNLNFDPNDAWISASARAAAGHERALVYQVHGEWVARGSA